MFFVTRLPILDNMKQSITMTNPLLTKSIISLTSIEEYQRLHLDRFRLHGGLNGARNQATKCRNNDLYLVSDL